MKNIFETIKANKGIVLKRGLIALGVVSVITLIGKAISGTNTEEEDFEGDDAENDSDENN
jgi:hypothetical protein